MDIRIREGFRSIGLGFRSIALCPLRRPNLILKNLQVMNCRIEYIGSRRTEQDRQKYKAEMVKLGYTEYFAQKAMERLDKEVESYER